MKLKSAPITLCWPRHGRSRSIDGVKVKEVGKNSGLSNGGQFWKSTRWFRAPPKVRLVSGVLGLHPSAPVGVSCLRVGDDKRKDDPESGHLPVESKAPPRVGGLPHFQSPTLDPFLPNCQS